MNTAGLTKGDFVKCRVRGKEFTARYDGPGEGLAVGTHKVEPVERWATWRFLRSTQILGKVDRQERMAVGV